MASSAAFQSDAESIASSDYESYLGEIVAADNTMSNFTTAFSHFRGLTGFYCCKRVDALSETKDEREAQRKRDSDGRSWMAVHGRQLMMNRMWGLENEKRGMERLRAQLMVASGL